MRKITARLAIASAATLIATTAGVAVSTPAFANPWYTCRVSLENDNTTLVTCPGEPGGWTVSAGAMCQPAPPLPDDPVVTYGPRVRLPDSGTLTLRADCGGAPLSGVSISIS